ncbi:hypothetical protein cyc_04544 [Cyclospora cayetanensis]|nr:hypothetical protein cyc_04544 [Cyclospora cayetanensis]
MRIVQNMDASASDDSISDSGGNRSRSRSISTNTRNPDKAQQSASVGDIPAQPCIHDSDFNKEGKEKRLSSFLYGLSVFLGIGAAVKSVLREDASPHYLFESLGFEYAPLSWTLICYLCGACLYMPLPLLLVISLAELVQQHGRCLAQFCRAVVSVASGERASDMISRRKLALMSTLSSIHMVFAAVRPLVMRFVFFIVSFCFTSTCLRIAVTGMCQEQPEVQLVQQ